MTCGKRTVLIDQLLGTMQEITVFATARVCTVWIALIVYGNGGKIGKIIIILYLSIAELF